MNENILIISYFTNWVTHFGTELEIAQVHLDQGDSVEFLGCDRCMTTCEGNPRGRISKCDKCRLRRSGGIRLLSSPVREHHLGDYLPAESKTVEAAIHAEIRDAESAEAYTFNGHDFGSGALSSAIWNARDPFCENEGAIEVARDYARSSIRSYLAVREFLKSRPDIRKVYVFNGRFATTRGALRACQDVEGLEVVTHERGADIHKYGLFPNAMPHDRELWVRETERKWQEADDQDRAMETGSAFYRERKLGENNEWYSYIEKQEAGKLPAGWDPKHRNVVVFNSSEDEFVGLGEEWKNPIYPFQGEGIRQIVDDSVERYPDVMFYLRVHPNLSGVQNRDTAFLVSLKESGRKNLVVIDPDSDISSYSLLDAADQVITFGSTVGIEATFWGKPSILAGRAFFEDGDSIYRARSHDDLMDLIGTALDPKPKIDAIKYAYYTKTFGEDFKYWAADGFSDGLFRGKAVKCEPRSWLVRRLRMFATDLMRKLR